MKIEQYLPPLLRDQTLVLLALKESLPQTMTVNNLSVYLRSHYLYVGVPNAMIAQQWIFIKKTIIDNLLKKSIKINDIRIQVDPSLNVEPELKNETPCRQCGSTLLRKGETRCALCQSNALDIERQRVFNFLREAPWLRYQDLEENDKKLIDYEAFMRERTFQIKRTYDRITLEYWSWYQTKDLIKLNQLKTSIEEYVITKLNIHPQYLNNETIKANISLRWFKLYTMTSQ